MPRPKKDYKSLNVKLDSGIMDRFVSYCDVMGQTKTTALERILAKHLDEFECLDITDEKQGAEIPHEAGKR